MRVGQIAGMTQAGLESAALNHDIPAAASSMAPLCSARVKDRIVGQDTEETRAQPCDG
jgi:hypothetical protein